MESEVVSRDLPVESVKPSLKRVTCYDVPASFQVYPVNTTEKDPRPDISRLHPLYPRPHNIEIFLGPPNAGKTSLMVNRLLQENGNLGMFDDIYIISQNARVDPKWARVDIPEDHIIEDWDVEAVQMMEDLAARQAKAIKDKSYVRNVLIVLDDFLGMGVVQKHREQNFLNKLAPIHRWRAITLWCSAQRLTALPPIIRDVATDFIVFNVMGSDLESIRKHLAGHIHRDVFMRMFKDATSSNDGYGFLHVTRAVNKHTPQHFRKNFESVYNII